MNFHWLFFSLAAGATTPHNSCMLSDPELIYCPAPEAPRITELRGGAIVLELQIDPDGSVRSSAVLSSSGHSAWPSVAQSAVAKWRYSANSDSRIRKVPFDFQLGSP